jgi:ubiquinone/menaquinone biosynthesis C-methylase UbiE
LIDRIYSFCLRIILRVFFRLLYHELAWTYDWVAAAVSVGHWSEWVQQAKPFVRGQQILELGFGPGHLQEDLRNSGYIVFGLDRSQQMCRLAGSRLNNRQVTKNNGGYAQSANLVQGVGSRLPFKNASFHSILSTFPTEYIFEPTTAVEIVRVLSPGGRLIIVLTAWITGKTLRERASALLFRLTGQSEPWYDAWQTPFAAYGLSVHTAWVDLGHSRVCVLTADKS